VARLWSTHDRHNGHRTLPLDRMHLCDDVNEHHRVEREYAPYPGLVVHRELLFKDGFVFAILSTITTVLVVC